MVLRPVPTVISNSFLEGQSAALRSKYYSVFKEKMGSGTAARFSAGEQTLASLIDLLLVAKWDHHFDPRTAQGFRLD